ncbi:MAG: glycerate kinase [Candidatus Undinarchaeales archaeon]|nr:glycerate kinase [Candidatus Undinarchaeales archaeon]MDP7491786.1 glycerate kinase [Candidatus Undinarchaeales archaeon]
MTGAMVYDLAPARDLLLDLLGRALKEADPAAAVRASLKLDDNVLEAVGEHIPLETDGNVFVIAFGKAAPAMAEAADEILGDRLAGGVVIAPPGLSLTSDRLEFIVGGHPVPDQGSVQGAKTAIAVAEAACEGDIVLVLVSGGGSALLAAPAGISLAEMRTLTQALLVSGAPISDLNAVRKHLSRVKGGRLAVACHPARTVALLVSDVVGDDMSVIASGPTVPDPTTCADAKAALMRADINASSTVKDALKVNESPKPGDPRFANVTTRLILGNEGALKACCQLAREMGVNSILISGELEGESRDVGRAHAALARSVLDVGVPVERPALLVSGGETTVTVRGGGNGGPNQEFALACVRPLDTLPVVALAVDSDGHDGPTDAAGAVVDGTSLHRAQAVGLDPDSFLERNNAYAFFEQIGDLIRMGRTGTNVNDVRLCYIP